MAFEMLCYRNVNNLLNEKFINKLRTEGRVGALSILPW